MRSIEMPAGWAGRRKDVLLALSIVNVTALVWLATLPASTWLYGGLCVLQIGLAASWPKSVRSPDLPVEIRGHGLTIHDGHGTAVAVPWSRVSSVARPGPHLCGDIAIDLNPVITGLPSRILVHGYTRDAERLLAAWELIESWRAAGLSVPGIVVDVPDSALSLARLTNDVPGDRGLSVADDPESQSTVASRSA
ncbi:MAG: hypothetical protein HZB16_10405 [Armatimonadetes bacterium]|nr:hypothetical protein [Armatimonadota bacterium]